MSGPERNLSGIGRLRPSPSGARVVLLVGRGIHSNWRTRVQVYADAVPALVRYSLDRARGEDLVNPLTPRELDVLKLVAEGHISDEIAESAS